MKTWVKWTLVAGAGVGTLALAGWAMQRHEAKNEAKQLGDGTGVAELDYAYDVPKLLLAAGKQVGRAVTGTPLEDYRKAEDRSKFWGAPSYDAEAYAKAAYWLAVASRLVKSKELASQATNTLARGNALFALPGSSQKTEGAAEIMREARAAVKARSGTNRQMAAVLAALGQLSSEKAVDNAKKTTRDKAHINRGIEKTSDDLTQLVETATGIVTGKKPKGYGPAGWFATKWGVRTLVIGGVVLGIRLYLGRPLLPVIKHAVLARFGRGGNEE